jgi:hypothetical protein
MRNSRAVADLTGGAGDGNANRLLAHGENSGKVVVKEVKPKSVVGAGRWPGAQIRGKTGKKWFNDTASSVSAKTL